MTAELAINGTTPLQRLKSPEGYGGIICCTTNYHF